jgi:hypothetical protein
MQVTAFNGVMLRRCAHHQLPFLDPFSLTVNATSFDGLNYGLDVHVLKAQLLLNVIGRIRNVTEEGQ